jgi:Tat protein translocase TatB subunit
MLNIGPQELILVLIVALVVVGPQKLPELGRTIGKAMREFRKIQDDVKDTIRFDMDDDPEPYARPKTTPRTPTPTPNAAGTAGALPAPTDLADEPHVSAGEDPVVSDGSGNGHAGDDASPDTTADPEPRAAE